MNESPKCDQRSLLDPQQRAERAPSTRVNALSDSFNETHMGFFFAPPFCKLSFSLMLVCIVSHADRLIALITAPNPNRNAGITQMQLWSWDPHAATFSTFHLKPDYHLKHVSLSHVTCLIIRSITDELHSDVPVLFGRRMFSVGETRALAQMQSKHERKWRFNWRWASVCVSLNVFSRELPQTFSTHGSISGSDTAPLTFTFYCLLQVC